MQSGAMAGVIAGFVTYPFDLTRTVLSTNKGHKHESVLGVMKRVFSNSGVLGFFKGFLPSTIGVAVWVSVNMTLFDVLKI